MKTRPSPQFILRHLHAWLAALVFCLLTSDTAHAKPGYALAFNGADAYVDMAAAVIPTSGDFTVECWFNCPTAPNAYKEILSQGSSGNAFYIGTDPVNNFRVGEAWGTWGTAIPLPIGGWHHVAVVKSSTNTIFYLDGTNRLAKGSAIPNPASASGFRLGRQYGSNGEYWPGSIDEVRVWNVARSADQIATSRFCTLAAQAGLVGYWPFNLNGGSAVTADVSGQGHNGTRVNSPAFVISQAPVFPAITIHLLGANPLTNECPSAFSDPGAVLWTSAGSIAAGEGHSLALKADGTVVAWGLNQYGQLNVPASATNVVALAAYKYRSLALKTDGSIVVWGSEAFGYTQAAVPASATNVVALAAGQNHHLALRADGTIVAWGTLNDKGQLNVPASATNVVAIVASSDHSLALKADGSVVAWGDNAYGETTVPASATNVIALATGYFQSQALKADGSVVAWGQMSSETTLPAWATNVVAIAAGWEHVLVMKADGTLAAWGNNISGQANVPASATNVVAFAAGQSHSLAVKANGSVVAWGDNAYGETVVPASASAANVVAIAAGGSHSLELKPDGSVVAWGANGDGQSVVPASATNVVGLVAGSSHSLALRADGLVVAWGLNISGQTSVPMTALNAVALAAGEGHSLALKADGTVVAWGYNQYSQTSVPASANNVIALAAGGNHSLALKADGSIVAWGLNSSGQTTVPALATNVIALAAGGSHSLALKADGSVVAWGSNSSGQTTVPASATNVIAIAASDNNSLALKADGSLVAWGSSSSGATTVPASATNVVAIAARGNHFMALRADSTVVGWGSNSSGQANVSAGVNSLDMIKVSGAVDPHTPGTYSLTYSFMNSAGYLLASTSRTVTMVDTTPPVLTLIGNNPLLVTNASLAFTDPGATAYDACAGSLAVTANSTVNLNFPGVYSITYTATDNYGHTATIQRTVNVLLPAAAPGDTNGDGVVSASEATTVLQSLSHSDLSSAIQTYWINNTTQISGFTSVSPGQFTIGLTNTDGLNFTVLVSTNLIEWQKLTDASPEFLFHDAAAINAPQRFYRLLWP